MLIILVFIEQICTLNLEVLRLCLSVSNWKSGVGSPKDVCVIFSLLQEVISFYLQLKIHVMCVKDSSAKG